MATEKGGPGGGGMQYMPVPTWNGEADTLDAYIEEVELLVLGTGNEQRKYLGPRLVAALPKGSTQQKAAARLSRDPEDLSGIAVDKGAENIIEVFKRTLGTRPLPLAAEKIIKYFKNSARQRGETMGYFAERELDVHNEALKAVQAIDPKVSELVPDVVRCMLVWKNAGLSGPEKASIAG